MSEDQIRNLAYLNWERAGRPEGDGVEFWLKAEEELNYEAFLEEVREKPRVAAKRSRK